MEELIQRNQKYAAVAISATGCVVELSQPIHLPDGFAVCKGIPFEVTPWWRQQLGEMQCEEIENADVYLVARVHSKKLDILNEENNALISKCRDFLSAIHLTGFFNYGSDTRIVSGSNVDDEISFLTIGSLPETTVISGTKFGSLDPDRVQLSFDIYTSFSEFITGQDEGNRVFWAINTFLDGLCARHVYDKIGNFIRTIEAFIMPEEGSTKKQFKSRTELFIGEGKHELIEDLYSVRSAIVHLHDPLAIIDGNSKIEKFRKLLELGMVAESIARHCLGRFALCRELWNHFTDDRRIKTFWQMDRKSQVDLWGAPYDVSEVKTHFDPLKVKYRERLKETTT